MAKYLVDVFGDSLVTQPLKTHPIEDNYPLPSPNDLKYKILIKNKKLHQNINSKPSNLSGQSFIQKTDSTVTSFSDQIYCMETISTSPIRSCHSNPAMDSIYHRHKVFNEGRNGTQAVEFNLPLASNNNRNEILSEEDHNSSDDDDISTTTTTDNTVEINDSNLNSNSSEVLISDQSTNMGNNLSHPINNDAPAESKATTAMSDLVHYIVPVRFVTFAHAEERNRSYEISSFSEDKAQSLIRDHAKDFVAYNYRQLSRIYPRGTRFESSNYNPYLFWPVGCQMVALNYQTLGDEQKKYSYLF